MAGAAMDQGRHLLDSAREQATGYVDERKNDVAESVVNLANSLRETGGAFEGREQIRGLVESAAGGLEHLAEGIRSRSLGDVLGDVEDLVRRRPMTAAVATMAAGFLIARFVKASAESARRGGRETRPFSADGRRGQGARGPADPSLRGQARA
ncbi:MAG TPA: hypothetical protein VFY72_01960 [Beijerinckiaceae bacterium]|nr:hypothetical protein [Beijerinckiaceae bacterium]